MEMKRKEQEEKATLLCKVRKRFTEESKKSFENEIDKNNLIKLVIT